MDDLAGILGMSETVIPCSVIKITFLSDGRLSVRFNQRRRQVLENENYPLEKNPGGLGVFAGELPGKLISDSSICCGEEEYPGIYKHVEEQLKRLGDNDFLIRAG